MERLIPSRLALAVASAATLGGATLLAAFTTDGASHRDDGLAQTSATAGAAFVAPLIGLDFPICHAPATADATRAMIRLAQTLSLIHISEPTRRS